MSTFENTIVKVTEKVGPRPSRSTFDCVQSQARKINTRCQKKETKIQLNANIKCAIQYYVVVYGDIVCIIVVIVSLSSHPERKGGKNKIK